jgi:flagellin FlaB
MGKKLIKVLEKKDFGSIGIGAMIVFIAMVLVAGIAASVLVQTSTRLEMQALKTGQETIAEVSSGITVQTVEGYNTSGSITKMAVEICPKAGSPDIDLEQAIIEISDSSNKYVLTYGSSLTNTTTINGDLFTNGQFGTGTTFGITVLQDADDSCTASAPVINFGDHVILGIDTDAVFSGISPRTDVNGLVVCEEGAPGIIGFTTPSSYIDSIMELQ